MTEELLKRLEEIEPGSNGNYSRNPDGPEAAALIRQLKADNERMREAAYAVTCADDHAPAMSSIKRIEWFRLQYRPAIALLRRAAQSLNQTERGER